MQQIPGSNRVATFTIGASTFGYRLRSRADEAEVMRRFALKTALLPDELNELDGNNLLWEARLEVGLRPRIGVGDRRIDLGERAPEHWLVASEGGSLISFDDVPVEEFNAVVDHLMRLEDAKKKPTEA